MEKDRDQGIEKENVSLGWSRRLFAGSLVSGIGLALARLGKGQRLAAPVSMKEASHYTPWDGEEALK